MRVQFTTLKKGQFEALASANATANSRELDGDLVRRLSTAASRCRCCCLLQRQWRCVCVCRGADRMIPPLPLGNCVVWYVHLHTGLQLHEYPNRRAIIMRQQEGRSGTTCTPTPAPSPHVESHPNTRRANLLSVYG